MCMVRHGERSCKNPFAAASGKCESPKPEMDFCHLLGDTGRVHQPRGRAWVTTLYDGRRGILDSNMYSTVNNV